MLRFDDLENRVKLNNAAASKEKADTIQKAADALEFAANEKHQGPASVALETGEVLAAAGCLRSRAQTLTDEVGGALEEAEAETPGEPNPKQLRIRFDGRSVEELLDQWGTDREPSSLLAQVLHPF